MRSLLSFFLILLITNSLSADILKVPTHFQSIQKAIDSAKNGDTVLVDQGVYYENLKIINKTITLASNFIFSNEKKDIDLTIIDGKGNTVIEIVKSDPEIPINELSLNSGFSVKSLERYFSIRIGLSPKKFARIMRFQKAHRMISKEGLATLVEVALSSEYYDQSHFNREFKKLVGYNPNDETMSILYNT